ncbi:PREDICTED: uncharacterized protein LOC106111722 [Papilio polytes]|uniref:uncharacterized protein LOC106111722 n=1 Tax=Papilio polytes TaxID=76194 RepID=UPI000675C430|nr:PREDICTED: uncharacterized protein LOC106111722 [Papilio polytes]
MAALSCYQPCRSHLAQPARCLDEEDNSATLSLRRRQFIERCQESRGGRHRDYIPEVSVKRTREELTKHAAAAPLTRRLNVDSSWSKVEEVRKKFEGATDTSYSRSFESPPRRRLADSLFASFKLPRKKEGMAAPRSLVPQPQQKRKSAVELLAETKAFYVKSETVLDRKQELPLRVSSGLSQAIAAGGCHLVSSGTPNTDACCNPYATTRSAGGARRAVSAGEGLQNTLRRLLEHSDSRENVYTPGYAICKFIEVFCYLWLAVTSSKSNSHSQPSMREEGCTNINSHKSLPDLHAQAHTYPEPATVGGTDTLGRSPRRRRHSAHHRTASCSSKGTSCYRSNHSSLISSCEAFSEHPSPGEENYQSYNSRCGSSFARDSGGSSGHYTQRSAPPHARPPRADSGSSTQHEHASAPPPQFQDEPPVYDYGDYECTYKAPLKCLNVGRHDYTARDYTRYHEPSTELVSKQPQYQEPRRPRHDDTQDYVNAPQQVCVGEEVTSPLGTFKRQRCLRYKQRRPRPILRSKSDISDSSTVDSNQLANAADYTVQGPGVQKQIYRNTEPPSVVERNARIIKWLCQCRKTQMQPPQ